MEQAKITLYTLLYDNRECICSRPSRDRECDPLLCLESERTSTSLRSFYISTRTVLGLSMKLKMTSFAIILTLIFQTICILQIR